MKKLLIISVLFTLAFIANAQDSKGASGWEWSKHTDAMTDQVQISFNKTTVEDGAPIILLIYLPADKEWVWGLYQHDPWTSEDTIKVTYRLGKDPAQTKRFFAQRGRFYNSIDDIQKFSSSGTAVVQPDGFDAFKYDLTGLTKTIALAGIKLK